MATLLMPRGLKFLFWLAVSGTGALAGLLGLLCQMVTGSALAGWAVSMGVLGGLGTAAYQALLAVHRSLTPRAT